MIRTTIDSVREIIEEGGTVGLEYANDARVYIAELRSRGLDAVWPARRPF